MGDLSTTESIRGRNFHPDCSKLVSPRRLGELCQESCRWAWLASTGLQQRRRVGYFGRREQHHRRADGGQADSRLSLLHLQSNQHCHRKCILVLQHGCRYKHAFLLRLYHPKIKLASVLSDTRSKHTYCTCLSSCFFGSFCS